MLLDGVDILLDSGHFQTTSDAEGYYEFADVVIGTHQIDVSVECYNDASNEEVIVFEAVTDPGFIPDTDSRSSDNVSGDIDEVNNIN